MRSFWHQIETAPEKPNLFLSMLMLSAVAIAQSVIPAGYESIYSVQGESARVPDTVELQPSLKLLSPTADWNTGGKVDVTGVSLVVDTVNIKINFEGSVEYAIEPAHASLKTVTWMSSDMTIAKVDEKGMVTGMKEGYANLIVTTSGGGFKDSCVIHISGYRDIPIGYASLYTLVYNDSGTLYGLDTLTTYPGANIPGPLISDNGSILGTEWNWNNPYQYCDVSGYSELVVAATFRQEDVCKDITFQYAFSTTDGSEITNRDVTIEQEEMLFVIDLDHDTSDVEDLKRLGAVKFRSLMEELRFVVDYAALKKVTSSIKKFSPGENNPASEMMAIYPTIPNRSFTIEFAQAPGFITVFDMTGKAVMQKTVYNSSKAIILKQGFYFVRHVSKGANKLVKVVHTH